MMALSRNTIRTIATYTALAIGVPVGGVVIGAMVIAPAVSRAKPLVQQVMGSSTAVVTKASASKPTVAVVAPFKPMASALELQAIVDSAETLARQVAPKPTGAAAFRTNAITLLNRATVETSRVPKTAWIAIDLSAIAMIAGLILLRRRRSTSSGAGLALSAVTAAPRTGASRTSRTPKAVVALAESGASATDIARRTRMPLDAVSMCLSMGSMGARQLQPPTA